MPRPFNSASCGAFYIFQEKSTGKSNYNSLQVSFKVNDWHGITSVSELRVFEVAGQLQRRRRLSS